MDLVHLAKVWGAWEGKEEDCMKKPSSFNLQWFYLKLPSSSSSNDKSIWFPNMLFTLHVCFLWKANLPLPLSYSSSSGQELESYISGLEGWSIQDGKAIVPKSLDNEVKATVIREDLQLDREFIRKFLDSLPGLQISFIDCMPFFFLTFCSYPAELTKFLGQASPSLIRA